MPPIQTNEILASVGESAAPTFADGTAFSRWLRTYAYQIIANEVSRVSHWFDRFVQWEPLPTDDGLLYSLVQAPEKQSGPVEQSSMRQREDLSLFLLNGNLNASADVHALLTQVRACMNRDSRLAVVIYSAYLHYAFKLLNGLGLRKGSLPATFITNSDLKNLAAIAGFEITRVQPVVHFPFRWFFIGPLLNTLLSNIPGIRWLALAEVAILRPVGAVTHQPSLSIIVPARNEAGNLFGLLDRLSGLSATKVEVIFVEGNSTDDTWSTIQEITRTYRGPFSLKSFQQSGKGKKDATEVGLTQASGELLTILDADLTMPPEYIARFYEAYCRGLGDLINGNRLLYPMEADAMRFLNWLGNIFFGKALSFVLAASIQDSLCGTKMFTRNHQRAMSRWNNAFGDFDPFGDFQILFPAAALGLGITDLPVPYKARTYGTTNIFRFRHGLQLLRMTLIGFVRIKLGRR